MCNWREKCLPESVLWPFHCFKLAPCLITNLSKNLLLHINMGQQLFENYKQA
jgi:hypothetical protein